MKIIDLTQTFTDNMPVYPGDPPSSLKQVASIEKETYTDHHINSVMHVGTHMDSPLHMIPNGKTLDEINPEQYFGKGILIDAQNRSVIDVDVLENVNLNNESIVFLFTGFSDKYRTQKYFENLPTITPAFAERLVKYKVKILGMDILGPDTDSTWPIHKILLSNNVLIVENLTNLRELVNIKSFDVIALPAKYHAEAAPVRVLALIKNN